MSENFVEEGDSYKAWFKDGVRHRDDGPAVVTENGTKRWYKNGELHREGGPAVERADGTKVWYKNGLKHREDGPAIEWSDGGRAWYQNGELHREDGPALERADGSKEWFQRDKLHREDGPAREDIWMYKGIYIGRTEKRDEVLWEKVTSDRILNGLYVDFDGTKHWYKNDRLHREDGPAVEYKNRKEWYWEGGLHREDGPAVEQVGGMNEWYYHNKALAMGNSGFWELWEILEEDKKVNPKLLRYLPK